MMEISIIPMTTSEDMDGKGYSFTFSISSLD